jgi:hypothetical protein
MVDNLIRCAVCFRMVRTCEFSWQDWLPSCAKLGAFAFEVGVNLRTAWHAWLHLSALPGPTERHPFPTPTLLVFLQGAKFLYLRILRPLLRRHQGKVDRLVTGTRTNLVSFIPHCASVSTRPSSFTPPVLAFLWLLFLTFAQPGACIPAYGHQVLVIAVASMKSTMNFDRPFSAHRLRSSSSNLVPCICAFPLASALPFIQHTTKCTMPQKGGLFSVQFSDALATPSCA